LQLKVFLSGHPRLAAKSCSSFELWNLIFPWDLAFGVLGFLEVALEHF
jgi:hypothetical protein